MKKDWDKLTDEWKDSKVGLVVDVDCSAAGESLCNKMGVEGFPTLKWGDPDSLEDYEGGRTFKALQKFATKSLKPLCGPSNLDECSDEKKAEITKYTALSAEDIDKQIEEQEAKVKALDDKLTAEIQKVEAQLEELEENKKKLSKKKLKRESERLEDKQEDLESAKGKKVAKVRKAGGLDLMKAVKKAMGNVGKQEL